MDQSGFGGSRKSLTYEILIYELDDEKESDAEHGGSTAEIMMGADDNADSTGEGENEDEDNARYQSNQRCKNYGRAINQRLPEG